MNAEHLLDAIGRLDDDLVRDAERYRRPKARFGPLPVWAASFAVAILLGYGATHFGMGGGSMSTNAGAGMGGDSGAGIPDTPSGSGTGAVGEDAPLGSWSTSPGDNTPYESSNGAGTEASGKPGDSEDPAWSGEAFSISLRLDGDRFTASFFPGAGIVEELPEGCVELGRLERLSGSEAPNVPYTDSEAYAGRPVWIRTEDPEVVTFYVGLSGGGYLASG